MLLNMKRCIQLFSKKQKNRRNPLKRLSRGQAHFQAILIFWGLLFSQLKSQPKILKNWCQLPSDHHLFIRKVYCSTSHINVEPFLESNPFAFASNHYSLVLLFVCGAYFLFNTKLKLITKYCKNFSFGCTFPFT